MKGGQVACDASDLPPGARLIVQLGRVSVGLFNIAGEIVAVRNLCPHAGAPVCEGLLTNAIVSDRPFERHIAFEGQILKCPWHGWEFKLPEGVTLTEPHERLRVYPVTIEHGKVLVHTQPRRNPAAASARDAVGSASASGSDG